MDESVLSVPFDDALSSFDASLIGNGIYFIRYYALNSEDQCSLSS